MGDDGAPSAGVTGAGADEDVAEELVKRITGIRRVIRRRLRRTLDGPALTSGQVELLRLVEVSAGISVSAAARAMHLAGNSVSTLVNQLTDAGYLRRETDPSDRRAARLYLTGAAISRLGHWRAARTLLVRDVLATLPSADRRAIARALPALGRLAEAMVMEET